MQASGDPAYGADFGGGDWSSSLVLSHNRDDGYRCGSPLLDSARLKINDLNVLSGHCRYNSVDRPILEFYIPTCK